MDDVATLVTAARAAAEQAYAPYSRFAVGAAIRLTDGTVVVGANVENASYGLSLCAEAMAIGKVANAGMLHSAVAIAIVGTSSAKPVFPCGRCRQMLNEAAALGRRDIAVHCAAGTTDRIEMHMLSALLPFAFGPAALK